MTSTTNRRSGFPVDDALLSSVLACYKPHCRYLTNATTSCEDGVLRTEGTFGIAESCYIDDTGHLNSVEVNICYNQALYATIAAAVHNGLCDALRSWTPADFHRRQLPDVVIAKFSAEFRRPIDPRAFNGQLTVDRAVARRLRHGEEPLVVLDTTFSFDDIAGGLCTGTARVAITGGAQHD